MQVLFHKHVWLYTEYMPTLHWWTGASSVSPYVMTVTWWRIRQNYPSLIRCLRVFHILVYAYLLSRCYCYNHYKIPKTLLLLSLLLLPLPPLSYYFATKHFAADTKFPGVVELTTQLLILENIVWLPLCRINKFGLNTLPLKTVAIPYTCVLSAHQKHIWPR